MISPRRRWRDTSFTLPSPPERFFTSKNSSPICTISLGKFSSKERPNIFSTISREVISGVTGLVPTISPLRMTVYWSQIWMISLIRWEMKMTPMFSVSRRWFTMRKSSTVSVSLRGAVGSSKMRKLHWLWMARAMRTICFWARDRSCTRVRTLMLVMFRRLSTSRACWWMEGQFMKGLPLLITVWLSITFSPTERVGTKAVSTSW